MALAELRQDSVAIAYGEINESWPFPSIFLVNWCTNFKYEKHNELDSTSARAKFNAIHFVHYTHTELSLAYPTLAEHSRVLLLAFH